MPIRLYKANKEIKIPAFAVMTVLLVALLIKSVLPTGFMPSFDKNGFTQITICSGLGEKTINIPSEKLPLSEHHKEQAEKICSFQLLASAKGLLNITSLTLSIFNVLVIEFPSPTERETSPSFNLSESARGPPLA